jgi:Flp pilus assembly secretin CpaC
MGASHQDSAVMLSLAFRRSLARLLLLPASAGALMLAMALSWPDEAKAVEDLIVNYDQSQLVKLSRPAAEIIVGNPSIADVTVQSGNLLVVTGKTFGITNMIILDAQRNVILDQRILVKRDEQKVVNLNRGTLRQSYNCTPQCNPSIVVGDDDAFFDSVSKASEKKIGFSERSTDQGAQQGGQ